MDRREKGNINIFGGATQAPPEASNGQAQGLSTLLVMIAVLAIILLFCFLGAPGVRDLCKRTVFKCCYPNENRDIPNLANDVEGQNEEFVKRTLSQKKRESIYKKTEHQLPQ